MDPAFDLALLQISAGGLPVIDWTDQPQTVAGAMLAAVGTDRTPAAIGILSAAERSLPGPFPTEVRPPVIRAAAPLASGKPTENGLRVDYFLGSLSGDEVQPGDLVLSIAGKEIREDSDLFACVDGHLAGEIVPVRFMRDGEERQASVLSY